MACRIPYDQLTDEQKKVIREQLYFQPKRTNFTVNKFLYNSMEKDPILFYWIDKSRNETYYLILSLTLYFKNMLILSTDIQPDHINLKGH